MGLVSRVFRSVWRRKTRAVLVVLALGFSIAILISIPSASQASTGLVESLVEGQSASYRGIIELAATEVVVAPSRQFEFGSEGGIMPGMPGGPGMRAQTYLNTSVVNEIADMAGVSAAVPQLQSLVVLEEEPTGDFRRDFMTLTGIPLDASLGEGYETQPDVTEGRKLQEGETGVALVGAELASNYGLGDYISLNGFSFEVVGVFQTGNPFTDRNAYVSLEEAQSVLDLEDQVSTVMVYAGEASEVDGIVDAIYAAFGDEVTVTTQEGLLESISQRYAQIEDLVAQQLTQVAGIANQEILVSAMVGGIIVLSTMFYTVRERTKEIGILKALGFTTSDVMLQFMLEGVVIGAIGGLIGVLISGVGASTLANVLLPSVSFLNPTGGLGVRFRAPGGQLGGFAYTNVAPDVGLMLLGLGVAVLLGGLGSLYPSWWASRKRPAEALRHE